MTLIFAALRSFAASGQPIVLRFTSDNLYDIVSDSEHAKYANIRKSVVELNPNLTFFDILREGDFITLSFRLGHGPDKADFKLLGEKHLFYQLAMGRNLEENLEKLTASDPGVEPSEAEKENGIISISIQYAWPSRLASEMEASSTGNLSEPGPAQPPSPKIPSGPSQEEQEKAAYDKAVGSGDEAALTRFIDDFPTSAHVDEARRRINLLREEAAYADASAKNTEAAYTHFLDQFPEASRQAEIKEKIIELQEKRKADEASRKAAEEKQKRKQQDAADKRRVEVYNQARNSNTADAYKLFLTVYPNAPETKEIKKLIIEIEKEEAAFEEARDSEEKLKLFLGLHPKGNHAEEAARTLQKMKTSRMENDYAKATEAGTAEALEKFLKKWPSGPKTSSIKTAIEKLRTPPAPPPSKAPEPPKLSEAAKSEQPPSSASASVPAPAGIVRLIAAKAQAKPRIDGVADDSVWEQAVPLELPVSGPKMKGLARLKAVHDGRNFYIMAEWEDSSRDTLFRPWIWDPAKKTYHQNEQADDAFAINFYIDKLPEQSCMLRGEEFEADLWMWRAYWSEISGLAYDRLLKVSRSRIPKANPYPAENGEGQVWIREESDSGTAGWRFFVPVGAFEGAVLPSYHPQNAEGSLDDVKARGTWRSQDGKGLWTVEMSRLLNTRNSDDIVLEPGKEVAIAIAIYDKAEKSRHSTSQIIRLILK